jgi:membrane protease YdiL (CAAX protease family)
MPDTPKAKIVLFLALTILFSGLVYWRILTPGSNAGFGSVIMLMWCPGIAALLTRLITQRNLRGEGWGLGRLRMLPVAYLLPLLYAGPVYLLAWLTGIGGFDPAGWSSPGMGADPLLGIWLLLSWGMVLSLFSATGEELGWRGLLVPELARLTSFRSAALISGAVWAAWHMPLIILAGYHGAGTPLLFSIVCFAIMAIGLSVFMAWLRLVADSVWPCALLHASHNVFVQSIFDAATVDRGGTAWLTGEFGAGLAVMALLFGWWALRRARRDGLDQVAKLGSSL